MRELPDSARAYMDNLETDRQAALALSKEKAEEAKLLQARLDGFQKALKMFARRIPRDGIGVSGDPPAPVANGDAEPAPRRKRRNISELIQRELSFSGQPVTTRQIAKAIEYHLEGTETALSRMAKDGQVRRDEAGRWVIGMKTLTRVNGHAAGASTVKTEPVRPDKAVVRLP